MSDKPERPGPIGELPEAFGIERMAQLVVWIIEADDYMDRIETENKRLRARDKDRPLLLDEIVRLIHLLHPISPRDAGLQDD